MTLTTLCLSRQLHRNEATAIRQAAERLACDEVDKLVREYLLSLSREQRDSVVVESVRKLEIGLRMQGIL